jgi:hypothetical protein
MALRIAEVQVENAVAAPGAEADCGSLDSDAIGQCKTSKKKFCMIFRLRFSA